MKQKRNSQVIVMWLVVLLAVSSASQVQSIELGEGTALPLEGEFMSPVWDPTGGGLAIAGGRFRGLYYTDLFGNVSTLSEAPLAGWRFSWSPDGQYLAYRVRHGDEMGMALMVAGREGDKPKQISPYMNDMFPPRWGEDGLTYRSGDELVTVDENGKVKNIHSLSQGRGLMARIANVAGSLMMGRVTGATFTAFGSRLCTQATDGEPGKGMFVDPDNQVWIVDEDGNMKKLIDVDGEHGYFNPSESPGGDKYAVCGFSGDLYVTDPNGNAVSLGAGTNPTWSPDGRHLIFERTIDDGHSIVSSDLWIASTDGSWFYQLTNTAEAELSPAWSPDGKWIAYVIDGQVYIAPIE